MSEAVTLRIKRLREIGTLGPGLKAKASWIKYTRSAGIALYAKHAPGDLPQLA